MTVSLYQILVVLLFYNLYLLFLNRSRLPELKKIQKLILPLLFVN